MGRKQFTVNETKLRELIIYFSNKSDDLNDRWFGAIKLNKLLYFSDFIAFKRLGTPITGATYQKLSEGPAPREFLAARRHLLASEEVRLERRPVFNYVQQRMVANRRADLSLFTEREREIIDEVFDILLDKTAKEVSDLSHAEPGWLLAEYGENIIYESALIQPGPVPAEVSGHEVS